MIAASLAALVVCIAAAFGVQIGTIAALCAFGTAVACWLLRGGKLPPSAFDDHSTY